MYGPYEQSLLRNKSICIVSAFLKNWMLNSEPNTRKKVQVEQAMEAY